jgi:hypothetical protein
LKSVFSGFLPPESRAYENGLPKNGATIRVIFPFFAQPRHKQLFLFAHAKSPKVSHCPVQIDNARYLGNISALTKALDMILSDSPDREFSQIKKGHITCHPVLALLS